MGMYLLVERQITFPYVVTLCRTPAFVVCRPEQLVRLDDRKEAADVTRRSTSRRHENIRRHFVADGRAIVESRHTAVVVANSVR